MKLSCLPVSFYQDLSAGRRTLGDWFRFAAELGLDGADMSVAHLASRDPAYLDGLRSEADDAGVQISMIVTYADFTHPDAAVRARQPDDVRAYIDVAARLGTTFLRVPAGQNHPGVGRAEGIDWAVAGLLSCLDDAAKAGVTLCYENHTIGYGWTHYDFSQKVDIFLEIFRRTEGSGLKLLFDTANTLSTGDDAVAVLHQVKHRVAIVHVNDLHEVGKFQPVLLGTGVAPVKQIFEVLVADGFDGWLSVEEASKTGDAGLRTAIPLAEKLWLEAGGRARGVTG